MSQDPLIQSAQVNGGSLFIMGVDDEGRGRSRWIREIKGSGPIEVLLLENHPYFEQIPNTRKYILKEK